MSPQKYPSNMYNTAAYMLIQKVMEHLGKCALIRQRPTFNMIAYNGFKWAYAYT